MGHMAFGGINTALIDDTTARKIILAAQSALDAVMAAGIPLTQDEQRFIAGIPPVLWTQMQTAILAAFDAGKTVTLTAGSVGAYALVPSASTGETVALLLNGPYPIGYDQQS